MMKDVFTEAGNYVPEQTMVRHYSQASIKRYAYYLILMNVSQFERCCGKVTRLKMEKNGMGRPRKRSYFNFRIWHCVSLDRERETKIKKLARTRYIWKVQIEEPNRRNSKAQQKFNLLFKRKNEKKRV